MQYYTIPGDTGAVMWEGPGGSGVIRPGDEGWASYVEWQKEGNTATPLGGAPDVLTLAEARAQAADRINRAADDALAPILSQYPAAEIASWNEQLGEAERWLADPSTPTPLVDGIVGSGDKADLCRSIVFESHCIQAAGRGGDWLATRRERVGGGLR